MRILSIIFLAFFALPLNAAEFSTKEHEKIMQYLNNISTLQADFVQTSADGEKSSGVFSLARPGKLRWEYIQPEKILIILNHRVSAYYDVELDELTQVTNNVLASFLAEENLVLPNDKLLIVRSDARSGRFFMTVTQRKNADEGEVTLQFEQEPLALVGISVKDGNGEVTEVKLSNHKYGISLADKLFSFPKTRSPSQSRQSF